MAEWSNALVLKTSVPSGTGGSNPSPSAGSGLFVGLDLGTGGVRALVVDGTGHILGRASAPIASFRSGSRHEQRPDQWWNATSGVLRRALDYAGADGNQLEGIAVDGTSGTLVLVDRTGQSVGNSIMYDDARARKEALELQEAGLERAAPSWALPKAYWIRHHEAARFERSRYLHSQASWVAGQLTGSHATIDYSNALKLGVDLLTNAWPSTLPDAICNRLPQVVEPATVIGSVTREASRSCGLPRGLPVIAGATDGTASFLASGANRLGECNTTLGTTLVFKVVADHPGTDPMVYAHKLPGGRFLPGAASNTGGAWVTAADPGAWDRAAKPFIESIPAAYPLTGTGERFPFTHPQAHGHWPASLTPEARHASGLVGTACVERMSYEVLERATGERIDHVYSTGSGSSSDIWMQIRADLCQRTLHRPLCTDTAMGAAVLAAAGTRFGTLDDAVSAMTGIRDTFIPERDMDTTYKQFLNLVAPYSTPP